MILAVGGRADAWWTAGPAALLSVSCHDASPNGQPRATDRRKASSSPSVCGVRTCRSQRRGSASGLGTRPSRKGHNDQRAATRPSRVPSGRTPRATARWALLGRRGAPLSRPLAWAAEFDPFGAARRLRRTSGILQGWANGLYGRAAVGTKPAPNRLRRRSRMAIDGHFRHARYSARASARVGRMQRHAARSAGPSAAKGGGRPAERGWLVAPRQPVPKHGPSTGCAEMGVNAHEDRPKPSCRGTNVASKIQVGNASRRRRTPAGTAVCLTQPTSSRPKTPRRRW